MSTFEWRANDDEDEANKRLDNGDGALFVCQPSASSGCSQPTLTLMPRVKSKPSYPSIPSTMIVEPGPGDDLTPPNAVQAKNVNGIAISVSASAGWSKSPPAQEGVYPSAIAYDLQLKTNTNATNNSKSNNDNSLEMTVSLEYTNPHASHGETMMVKVAIAKTLVQAETGAELALVATQFQEYLDEKKEWIDITADVEYTQTANAVVDAVLADPNADQTAGKATVTTEMIELTLGPFSVKARLNLTFQAELLYTYDAMSTHVDGSDIGTHRLLPLWVTLPFAQTDNEGGLSDLSVRFQAPAGALVLSIDANSEAYWDLKQQDVMKSSTILAVPELVPQAPPSTAAPTNGGGTVGYQFQWDSLPPRSCGILAWLALPNPVDDNDDCGFDFVHIGRTLEEMSDSMVQEPAVLTSANSIKTQAQAVLQVPSAEDMASLQVPLPGHGPMGSLWRLNIKMPESQSRQTPNLILNLAMSDKSGSTGRMVGGNGGADATTMRQRFNELTESRFLKRLESIPQLVQAGVLLLDDVWMDVFLAFDNAAPRMSIHRVTFCVKDICDSIVEVVQSIRTAGSVSAVCSSSNWLTTILEHVKALRAVKPSGLTDFSVAPSTLVAEFAQWHEEAESFAAKKLQTCSFVEFDTDGGHNGRGDYLESLKRLCEIYDVRNGVVTGFGSWLNQDCASKVARTIGSIPAQLSLEVPQPGTEGMDKVFRRGFSAWVSALRQPPSLTVKISAGSVSIPSFRPRNTNAIEVLALRSAGDSSRLPKFMAPDVTNESYTKTKIEGAPAGEELVIYLVSRLDSASQLVKALDIETSAEGVTAPVKANVRADREVSTGNFLAFHWLRMLTGRSGENSFEIVPLMATLGTRLEDEVSFRFNISSPSGRTSYLGRCKTVANRASIDAAHQPAPPESPLEVLPPKPPPDDFRFSRSASLIDRGGFYTAKKKTLKLHFRQQQGQCQQEQEAPPHFAMRRAPPLQPQRRQLSEAAWRAKRAHTAAKPKISKSSWIDALEVPIGSRKPLPSKQDYKDLQRALAVVGHAVERLRGKVNINFVCDVCNRPIGSGENRYHCFDCKDFDGCTRCKDGHKPPFHRIALVAPNGIPANQAETAASVSTEDPLVDMLLEQSKEALPVAVATLEPCLPEVDRTRVWCEDQVRRFLLVILHWWPLYRGQCVFRDKLPESVSEAMVERILQCCYGADVHASHSSENVEAMLSTLSVIMDSLLRLDPSLQLVTNEAFGF